MWTQLVLFVKVLWSTQLGKLVFGAVKELLNKHAKDEVDKLAKIARRKALEVEAQYGALTGPEKREIVLQYLKDAAIAEGLEVGTATLNFLIESAVQVLDKLDD